MTENFSTIETIYSFKIQNLILILNFVKINYALFATSLLYKIKRFFTLILLVLSFYTNSKMYFSNNDFLHLLLFEIYRYSKFIVDLSSIRIYLWTYNTLIRFFDFKICINQSIQSINQSINHLLSHANIRTCRFRVNFDRIVVSNRVIETS